VGIFAFVVAGKSFHAVLWKQEPFSKHLWAVRGLTGGLAAFLLAYVFYRD
jgi:hypothetical protein